MIFYDLHTSVYKVLRELEYICIKHMIKENGFKKENDLMWPSMTSKRKLYFTVTQFLWDIKELMFLKNKKKDIIIWSFIRIQNIGLFNNIKK